RETHASVAHRIPWAPGTENTLWQCSPALLRPLHRGDDRMPVVEVNGRRRVVSADYGTSRACAFCGGTFPVTNITGRQFYCSDSCKEKALWRVERTRPDVLSYQRAKCRDWAARNRNVRGRNAWLLGAPPYHQYLPGGGFRFDVRPLRW